MRSRVECMDKVRHKVLYWYYFFLLKKWLQLKLINMFTITDAQARLWFTLVSFFKRSTFKRPKFYTVCCLKLKSLFRRKLRRNVPGKNKRIISDSKRVNSIISLVIYYSALISVMLRIYSNKFDIMPASVSLPSVLIPRWKYLRINFSS